MFKYETRKPLTEQEFINAIANDIVEQMDDEAKAWWLNNPEYDHFGRGMAIRNEYLWVRNLPTYREPDDLSVDIFTKVIEILKEQGGQ